MYLFKGEKNNIQLLLGDNFKIQYVDKPYSNVSTLEFNRIFLMMYEKYREQNEEQDPHKNENSCTYAKISLNLNIDMINHINSIQNTEKPDLFLSKYLKILNAGEIQNFIRIRDEFYTNEASCRNILPTVLANWKSKSEE